MFSFTNVQYIECCPFIPPLEARQVTKSSNSPLRCVLPREAKFTELEKWFILFFNHSLY